ncbi:MAG: hypothetical protein Q9214_004290, partial [Letrouitia sp. 1 TL-2023]
MAFHNASKTINVGQLSEDAVSDQIHRSLIEVSNGIAAGKVLFTSTGDLDSFSIRRVAEKALSKALTGPYRWAVRCYWVEDEEPVLIIVSTRQYNSHKPSNSGLLNALLELESSEPTPKILYQLAYELNNRSLHHTAPKQANGATSKLLSIAQSDNILLATLAAEILTHQGSPTLPMQAIIKTQQKAGGFINLNGTSKHVAATSEKGTN